MAEAGGDDWLALFAELKTEYDGGKWATNEASAVKLGNMWVALVDAMLKGVFNDFAREYWNCVLEPYYEKRKPCLSSNSGWESPFLLERAQTMARNWAGRAATLRDACPQIATMGYSLWQLARARQWHDVATPSKTYSVFIAHRYAANVSFTTMHAVSPPIVFSSTYNLPLLHQTTINTIGGIIETPTPVFRLDVDAPQFTTWVAQMCFGCGTYPTGSPRDTFVMSPDWDDDVSPELRAIASVIVPLLGRSHRVEVMNEITYRDMLRARFAPQ
jgi:hypothetical protein